MYDEENWQREKSRDFAEASTITKRRTKDITLNADHYPYMVFFEIRLWLESLFMSRGKPRDGPAALGSLDETGF
jgi:hypothetical protein